MIDRISININKEATVSVSLDSDSERVPLINHASIASIQSTKKTFTSSVELEAEIKREMRKYRLKHIFCQSYSTFCRSCRSRLPSEKSVYLALALCLFERLAYYAAVGNILQPYLAAAYPNVSSAVRSLLFSIFMDMMAQLLFPLFGWIADAWVGRYTMLHFSLWFLWFGYGMMTLLFTLDNQVTWNRYLLPLWMIIINIGSAGFQASAIPFGADQVLYGSSNQISSFFYWYYWLRNLGAIFLFLSISCENHHTQWQGYVTFGLVSTASMSVTLTLNGLMRNWFFIDNQKTNPIWNIIKIFVATTTAKHPKIRSAFSFSSLPAPTRMDLTKEVHGGKFDSEEVENAKTVGRMLTVLLSASGALIIVRGILNIIEVQVQGMEGESPLIFNVVLLKHCNFDSNFTWILNVVVILVTIPVLNQCAIPFLREYRLNMLKKIAIGYLLVVLASVSMLAIIGVGENILEYSDGGCENSTRMCLFSDLGHRGFIKLPVHPLSVTVPHVLISVAEIFINISCLEFCYAQSPHNIRGLMVGFFFFIWGVSDTVATSILTVFSLNTFGPPVAESCNFWYHLILLVIGLVTFTIYILVARRYQNRKRPISNENYVYYNLMNGQ